MAELIRKQRELDGRPCLTVNKLPAFIRQVVNDARQNKPAIKVSPQDSNADPHTAEIITGLIRNIERSSDADTVYDIALDCAVTGGFGYFRINTEYACDDSFDQNIVIQRSPTRSRSTATPSASVGTAPTGTPPSSSTRWTGSCSDVASRALTRSIGTAWATPACRPRGSTAMPSWSPSTGPAMRWRRRSSPFRMARWSD
jgi:hypothetical protein